MNDLQLLATLYCLHRRQLYIDYMRGSKLLAAHALGDNSSSYQTWLPKHDDTLSMAPDICSSCSSLHGYTSGGRLRLRCYDCKSANNCIDGYQVQQLAIIWGCSQEYTEFLLATALQLIAYQREHGYLSSANKQTTSQSETALT